MIRLSGAPERLRHTIIKSSVGGITDLNVTSSFGVSTAQLGDTVQTLLERADVCLYRAKETGRNRTCWESEVIDNEANDKAKEDQDMPQFIAHKGQFEFRERIEVATSLELTAMKLHAFIREYKVEILKQDHSQIQIRIGKLGFTRAGATLRNENHWKFKSSSKLLVRRRTRWQTTNIASRDHYGRPLRSHLTERRSHTAAES